MNARPRDRLGLWWTRFGAMTLKELIQLRRDGILVLAIFYLFVVDLYLAGNVSMDLKHAVVVAQDHDRSAASRELISRFQPPYFKLGSEVSSPQEAQRLLDHGEARLVLDIPHDFERNLQQGRQTAVQIQVDASNTVLGLLAANYGTQIIGQYGFDHTLDRLGATPAMLERLPVVQDEHRVWYNPNQRDAWFIPLSELLVVITVMAIMLPAAAAVREKERGTIEQLLVTPLTPIQILLPKVVAMTLVILLGTAVSMAMLRGVFDMPMKGSILLFFAVTTLYTFTTAGLGLYIATLSRNLAQAALFAILVLMPMIFLSGAWTPPEAMPPGLREAMLLSPLYYFIEMGYGILLKGAGVDVLWDSLLGLTVLGIAIFHIGIWRFRRQSG